jgi:hypothetical protein
VICVLPQAQAGEDGIATVYETITIAALCRFVILGQRQKTVEGSAGRRRRLRREVPEQFCTVVYLAVAVAVKDEPGVV